jgi:hypothetical protein
MNALRTIKQNESAKWMQLMLEEGPYLEQGDWVPEWPIVFPSPTALSRDLVGGYLYIVYNKWVYCYGKIWKIVRHEGTIVGTPQIEVSSGDAIVIDGVMNKMPTTLICEGFRNFITIPETLHEMPQGTAQAIIASLGLLPRGY